MTVLFTILFLVAIIGLVVGLIKPELAMKWSKDESKRTRKNVVKYFGIASVILFVLICISPDKEIGKEDPIIVEKVADVEEEPLLLKLSDSEEELLNKPVEDLTYEELEKRVELIKYTDDYKKEDKKLIMANEEQLMVKYEEEKAIKEAKEEEERIAREEQEEKDRIAAEKKAEEDRIAKEKTEKEKYNNTVSWDDIARDKEGKKGSYIKFKGKILQVMQDESVSQYRLAIDSDSNKVILIGISNDKLEQNILEDDIITIEGMSLGNTEYTTVMGAVRQIPLILVENVYTK